MSDEGDLARLLGALHPWLGELVIVGGWAHRLYRLVPQVQLPDYQPIQTRDADVAFSARGTLTGDIRGALMAAGFQEELAGDHTPPATWYRLGGDATGFYAEFVAPLTGSGHKRDGTPDATVSKAGVTAQKLRYVELLLASPWSLAAGGAHIEAIGIPGTTRIPNPVSFMVQKLLIHPYRTPAKRAQDVLYVHDTLELFSGQFDALRRLWHEELTRTIPERTVALVQASIQQQFGAMTDVVRQAARIPQDRAITPERIRRRCFEGMRQLLER